MQAFNEKLFILTNIFVFSEGEREHMLDKRKKFSHDTDTDVLEHSTF